MAQHSGFFNALEVNGVYDRKYNADDYTSNMGAIISTGVRRSGDDDLKVTASGLVISVAPGRAWIDGHWYYNDYAYTMDVYTPPSGALSRMDGVYLNLNTNEAKRKIELVYKVGTASATPTAPDCIRSGGEYEILLATVLVAPSATNVTVTDKRGDSTVCGWITSPIGYDDYFTSLDNAFEEWFDEKKDELASVTLFKRYQWRSVLASASSTVTFSIPQYDSTGVDIIEIYVSGMLCSSGYTLSDSTITFTEQLAAGTEVTVLCFKSIDGTGLGSVSDEITELQNEVAALGDVGQFYYFSTGTADNVALSTIVKNFLNGNLADGKHLKINVVGTFGVSAAASGNGQALATPYKWLDFSITSSSNRKVTVNFDNCTPISITLADNTYNTMISGSATIEGLELKAESTSTGTSYLLNVKGFDRAVTVRNSKIEIRGRSGIDYPEPYIATRGDFTDCDFTVVNDAGDAFCIYSFDSTKQIIRLNGGTFKAYTALSNSKAAGVYLETGASNTGVVITGTNFATVTKSGYYQKNSIRIMDGYCYGCMISALSPLYDSTTAIVNVNRIPL